MLSKCRTREIRTLCEVLRRGPRGKLREALDRTELLARQLEPGRQYAPSCLFAALELDPAAVGAGRAIEGSEAAVDLRALIEELSGLAKVKASEAGEDVFTVESLADRFHVATKTISRWREQGLVARRFLFGQRLRIGFLQSSVDWFVEQHPDMVRRAGDYSRLCDHERQGIAEMATNLLKEGIAAREIVNTVTEASGRSRETVRYVLQAEGVTSRRSRAAEAQNRTGIWAAYRRGESVANLALLYGKTPTTIYRLITEARTKWAFGLDLTFIVVEAAPIAPKHAGARILDDLEALRQINELKQTMLRVRGRLGVKSNTAEILDSLESMWARVQSLRQHLKAKYAALVEKVLEKAGDDADVVDQSTVCWTALERAIETFDFTTGRDFREYARARLHAALDRARKKVSTGSEASDAKGRMSPKQLEVAKRVENEELAAALSERERRVLEARLRGLDERGVRTLEDLAQEMGITKERVRQIQAAALAKLQRHETTTASPE